MNVGAIVAAAVTSFIAECMYGITGFGVAIIFQIGWHISGLVVEGTGDIVHGVANLTVMGIATQLLQLQVLHQSRDCTMAVLFAVSDTVGAALGTFTLTSIPAAHIVWLERGLGIFLLLIGLQRLYGVIKTELQIAREGREGKKEKKGEEKEEKGKEFDINLASHRAACAVAGFFAGFIGGMTGVGGPILMVFVTHYHPPLQAFKYANAVTRLTTPIARIVIFVAQKSDVFKVDQIPMYIALACMALLGVSYGNYLSEKVDLHVVNWIIIALLIAGSLLMCVAESPEGQTIAIALICSVVAGFAAWRCWKSLCSRRAMQAGHRAAGIELAADSAPAESGIATKVRNAVRATRVENEPQNLLTKGNTNVAL